MFFDNELEYLSLNESNEGNRNQRVKLTQLQLDNLLKQDSNLPTDYINYLSEVGAGNIMSSQFKVYEKLVDFTDLGLEDLYSLPNGIKLFGDNLSGDFAGFDLTKENPNEVVEFWHDSNQIFYTGKDFRQYIREKMLMV